MKLMLRKVQYAPESVGVAPSVETTRDFLMSDKPLHVKASLDKEVGASTFIVLFISTLTTFSGRQSGKSDAHNSSHLHLK